MSRYELAARIVPNGLILDVGCGDCLGTRRLLSESRELFGLDKELRGSRASRHAIGAAIGDACYLPFSDQAIDAIVSFETLEHVSEPKRFVVEGCRILKDDGLFLISTPNARASERGSRGRKGRQPGNPFHLHSFDVEQLSALLSPYFSKVEILGQVTTKRYGPSPFWTPAAFLSRTPTARIRICLWKLIRRLPSRLGERVSWMLLRRSLHPAINDFEFSTEGLATAHVLVAICREPRP